MAIQKKNAQHNVVNLQQPGNEKEAAIEESGDEDDDDENLSEHSSSSEEEDEEPTKPTEADKVFSPSTVSSIEHTD